MFRMEVLFQEWRAAIGLEAGDSKQSELILTARVRYSTSLSSVSTLLSPSVLIETE
ncbi:hypothetical protein Pint_14617 [Pistacia integerrima]|uniref:Uncharacterized protein n=1 Tax=Pistacia integerrima TaxID=434235 RepID=A0ACC0Y7P1_9ROSI|nr:hypothetical protein Pint_14617 [Pistacia integerrima]